MSTTPAPPPRASREVERGVPDATVGRLAGYARVLASLGDRGVGTVSSEELALAAGVGSATLRKDLSHLGSYGVRGVGYEVSHLLAQVGRWLGTSERYRVALVGVGSLGRALANYSGFAPRGTSVVALLDADPSLVGERVAGLRVLPVDDLEDVVVELGVRIGVLAVPAPAAQDVCDRMVAAGVTSVLSFAPTELAVPAGIDLRRVDLSTELAILAFRQRERDASGSAAAAAPPGALPTGALPAGEVVR